MGELKIPQDYVCICGEPIDPECFGEDWKFSGLLPMCLGGHFIRYTGYPHENFLKYHKLYTKVQYDVVRMQYETIKAAFKVKTCERCDGHGSPPPTRAICQVCQGAGVVPKSEGENHG